MRRPELLRSTPFRLALAFSGLALVTLLLGGLVASSFVTHELDAWRTRQVGNVMRGLDTSFMEGGDARLIDQVRQLAHAASDHETIFLLESSDGRRRAGNIEHFPASTGWSDIGAQRLGIDADGAYRVFDGAIGSHRILVGVTGTAVDEVSEIFQRSSALAAVVTSVLALAMGAALATTARRRLDAIGQTIRDVAGGTLSARIPLTGRGDDIDELAGNINVALERLEAVVQSMQRVSADIAHELRTPLTSLRIEIEQAAEELDAGGRPAEGLTRALHSVDRVNATFAALLRIAQIESRERRSRFKPTDLTSLAESVSEVYREVAEDAGHTFAFSKIGAEPTMILGDSELLTQMIANIIENAIRHCPPGSGISVAVAIRSDTVQLTISDTGAGIPEAERDKVLRPLYRLETSRTTEGAGLGLNLVKAIADLHDATLELADNNPGLRMVLTFSRADQSLT